MLRLARQMDRDHTQDKAQTVRDAAVQLLQALVDQYLEIDTDAQGLLRGGTYHAHKHWGIDAYFICGDYYFLEALMMLSGNCPDFWGPAS